MLIVQLQQLGFHQLSRVIVPGNTDTLAGGADRLCQQIQDPIQLRLINAGLQVMVVLDIGLEKLPVNFNRFFRRRFPPVPFRLKREGRRDRKGIGIGSIGICLIFTGSVCI